jgi:hypothetical protein
LVTTYVTGNALPTPAHERVSALLATTNDVSLGVAGGIGFNGVTVVLAAPLPLLCEATMETTYEVPPTRPVIVHEETATAAQEALPGIARAT